MGKTTIKYIRDETALQAMTVQCIIKQYQDLWETAYMGQKPGSRRPKKTGEHVVTGGDNQVLKPV
jgi:hypothetical protein